MSRRIKCTPEDAHKIIQMFESLVHKNNFPDGKISFAHNFQQFHDEATLVFSPIAWMKILNLVISFDKEIQWHGIVERISENSFRIKDVLVFPHEISETTVVSNQKEYEEWLNGLDDDTFNHLRFHGHSHVAMGVTPSSVDMQYRKNIVNNISSNDDEAYYIFIIINKNNRISAEIYDIENNIIYDTDDITFIAEMDDNNYASDFIKEARSVATERVFVSNKQYKKEKKKENHSSYNNNVIGFNDSPCNGCRDMDCQNCPHYYY